MARTDGARSVSGRTRKKREITTPRPIAYSKTHIYSKRQVAQGFSDLVAVTSTALGPFVAPLGDPSGSFRAAALGQW